MFYLLCNKLVGYCLQGKQGYDIIHSSRKGDGIFFELTFSQKLQSEDFTVYSCQSEYSAEDSKIVVFQLKVQPLAWTVSTRYTDSDENQTPSSHYGLVWFIFMAYQLL